MTGKQEGPYKGEETKAEEDKLWQLSAFRLQITKLIKSEWAKKKKTL